MHSSPNNHHLPRLSRLSALSRLSTLALLAAADALLPLFDASPRLLLLPLVARPLLRWDAFHFLHIALHHYPFLHSHAFFPALPFLMRTLSPLLSSFPFLSPAAAALLAATVPVLLLNPTDSLYQLSLLHLHDPSKAYLATLLSLLPPSPVTLFAVPYTEPYFTFLSYKAMLYAARSQWYHAAICFALAGFFRSNAIFLAIFVLWGLIVQPFLLHKSLPIASLIKATFLTAIVLAPFVYHDLTAYLNFCASSTSSPSWCTHFIPSAYTYVQKAYWDNGLFSYWTLQQLPNFIIAAPPLLVLFAFSIHYITNSLFPRLRSVFLSSPSKASADSFLSPSLAPHAIHALFLCCVLLFSSNTQIILRLASSMPIFYWACTWLLHAHPSLARAYLSWIIFWPPISVLLWAAFLPPA